MEIFKLQKPIVTTEESNCMVLAYNEDKSILSQIPVSIVTLDALSGEDYKVFYKARVDNKSGLLEIGDKIPANQWPDW